MGIKELYSILQKIIFLTIFSFVLFILSVNICKFAGYIVEIDKITTAALKNDSGKIDVIESAINNYNDFEYTNYNPDKAHTARELNYTDKLKTLRNSEWGEGINILVTGSDKKNFHEQRSRADVIILLRINKFGKVLSISIPRDTLITVSGRNNKKFNDKIGHSMYWNGLDGLKENVETLIGSPIYKVVIIDNFRSFEAFLSMMGGVSIDKRLEGRLGIQWIRNRSFKFGDIERCRRQQVFLYKSMIKIWKITGGGNYILSTVLFDNMRKIVQTDLSREDFIKILYLFKKTNFNPETDFMTAVLPGNFGTYDSLLLNKKNLSCWTLEDSVPEMLQLLFYSDLTIDTIIAGQTPGFGDFLKIDLNLLMNNVKNDLRKGSLFVKK